MRKIINTEKAPAPVGPYNQAVLNGHTLYISGQIAIDPETGQLLQDNIEEETHRVMQNIHAILLQAGSGFQHVLKCTVFVKDMNLYSRINDVYGKYFDHDAAPARELVEVANLPKFVNIEISTIAYVP
ncbi:MAG: Rid family detoxifying hydrolase [Saprospiraceae bacterium]|nr:Rid family detoxifying hydrolase [Saprospiraceae bacterium]